MQNKPKPGYVAYYDVLTILACIAVIYLHCNGIVHTFSPNAAWDQALIVEVLAYWAVPVFFMLTGAKTLNYRSRHTTLEFLTSRFRRLFVPFFFWSLIIFYLRNWQTLQVNGAHTGLGIFFNALMSNSIEPTYWFFWSMFSISIAMPALSLLINNDNAINYLIISSLIFTSILPTVFKLVGISWNTSLANPLVGDYLLYVLLGYRLSKDKLLFKDKGHRLLLYCLSIISFAIRYVYTYKTSYLLGATNKALFDYQSIIAVIPSIGVFVLIQQFEQTPLMTKLIDQRNVVNLLKKVSSSCFGIYLIHKIVLDNVLVGQLKIPMDSMLMRQGLPLVIFFICLVIVQIFKHLPLLKNLVP